MIGKRFSPEEYVKGVLNGDKVVLGRAITLIESINPADQDISDKILNLLMPHTGKSIRIGITGVPGVGKSTFIESFGTYLIKEKGKKVAVLAIDPSSQLSKGSILGDKTRMEQLSVNDKAFVRPSPTNLNLGGVAAKSREVLLLCEAAGFDVILIETVGVGQSETTVKGMVDFFLLLMLAGAGDDLQGIKRGIMEMVDHIAINKTDGDNTKASKEAQKQLKNALHFFPPAQSTWQPKVTTCSALIGVGLDQIWKTIEDYCSLTKSTGYFEKQRKNQNVKRMHEFIIDALSRDFYDKDGMAQKINEIEELIKAGKISPYQGGNMLFNPKSD